MKPSKLKVHFLFKNKYFYCNSFPLRAKYALLSEGVTCQHCLRAMREERNRLKILKRADNNNYTNVTKEEKR